MILYCDGMRQTLEWDRYYPLSPQSIEDKYWTSAGWNWTKSTFPLPGTQRGETLCNRPLAQHCAEEEEDGSSSPDVTSAICLPSWSQTLFSARTSAVSFNSSFSTVFVLGELNELEILHSNWQEAFLLVRSLLQLCLLPSFLRSYQWRVLWMLTEMI